MDITLLYGKNANTKEIETRIQNLENEHYDLFKTKPSAIFSTSGRTELGGNHTDHNLGKVLAGSINLDTLAAVHKTDNNTVTFISKGYSKISITLDDLSVREEERGRTKALIRGISYSIVKRGGVVGGFCANVTSSVLKGSGLSSSASIEVLIATIFNNLYNNDYFTTTELAIMGQEAENIYFGKPSGLMDQVACAYGGIVAIDFKNPKKPAITPIKIDFADYGYDLVITNTGGNHANLTDDYASIPLEMKNVASFFNKEYLREVSYLSFLRNIKKLRNHVQNDRAILRALHYFEENNRVDAMVHALKKKDITSYLKLINESGKSSYQYLQNIYSPSAFDAQGISLAYALTESFLNGEGAFRVQGGGFAGTIEAYIPQEMTKLYFDHMEKVFGKNCCTILAIRNYPTMRIK